MPDGVITKASLTRALTLPALPRFRSEVFSARAVAITCSRSARDSDALVTSRVPALLVGEHRREPFGAPRNAALGDETADEPRGRHVERVVDGARVGWRQRDTRGLAILVAAEDGEH